APRPVPPVVRVRIGIRIRSPGGGRGHDNLAALLDAVRHARLEGPEADHGGEQQRADENDPTLGVAHESILLSRDEDARPLWSDCGDGARASRCGQLLPDHLADGPWTLALVSERPNHPGSSSCSCAAPEDR